MPSNAQSVSARRAKAIALVQAGQVHSQSDLVVLLKKAGYKVTQATASRDLEEIGAVRARNKDGESTYLIRESSDDALVRTALIWRLFIRHQGQRSFWRALWIMLV
jgi:transcriptional regulator of arginine metabolism